MSKKLKIKLGVLFVLLFAPIILMGALCAPWVHWFYVPCVDPFNPGSGSPSQADAVYELRDDPASNAPLYLGIGDSLMWFNRDRCSNTGNI